MGKSDNDEDESSSPDDSDDPSTTSSKIRRRLGHRFSLRFILANNNWLVNVDTDTSHLSSIMPMPRYYFVIPDKDDTILSAPSGHFVVYQLAVDTGLSFPPPPTPFVG